MNGEMNLFNPLDLDLSRSTFHYSPMRAGTCNVGRLIPAFCTEILPGDSVKMNLKSLFKMSTPVYPTMDQLYADIYFFFVPNKLILSRRYGSPTLNDSVYSWKSFIGAQDNLLNMPLPQSGQQLPQLDLGQGGGPVPVGSLMDYYGYFTDYSQVNCLPVLGYFSIWNENFREPSTMESVTWDFSYDSGSGFYNLQPYGTVPIVSNKVERQNPSSTNDYLEVNALCVNGDTYVSTASSNPYFWLPFPVCRFHGIFGSMLPWPQRNSTGVKLPLGTVAPVVTGLLNSDTRNNKPLQFAFSDPNAVGAPANVLVGSDANAQAKTVTTSSTFGSGMVPANLWTDLSAATAANVNMLRAKIQEQRWYEKLARSGNRYDELEYGLFGVRPHDSGLDRPLYLGGKRIPLSIEMVASTQGGTTASGAQGAGSLGALGAFSHTNDSDSYFYHSFDDWGILHCVFCIRHHDTFATGTDMIWQRRTRADYYFPTFAHLGESAITANRLTDQTDDMNVLGYQQAWEEYRQETDRVTGLLRPGQNLGFMTYARDYGSSTSLPSFLNASSQIATVDKTLAVNSNASGFQFVYQFEFDYTMRRCLPTYSVPGLMDHF